MAASVGISIVYEKLQTELAGLDCSWGFGAHELSKADSPPRIVWVVKSVGASGRAAPANGGAHPAVQGDRYQNELHLWGATFEDAERMRHAVATALQKLLKGNWTDDGAEFSPLPGGSGTVLGWKCVFSASAYLVMPKTVYPATSSPPAQGTYAAPSARVTDKAYPPATAVETDYDTTGAAHDGELQAGET